MIVDRSRTVALPAAAAVAVAAIALAGCTSSGGDAPSASPTGSTAASERPTPSSSAASSSPAPLGLATIDGAYLVAGPSASRGDVYRVASGRYERVTRGAHVTAVTDDGRGTVVVGRESGGREVIQRLRSGTLVGLGIDDGFGPALSADGTLAWVSVDVAGSTPGISKPGGFTVHVRTTVTGRDRDAATFRSSAGALVSTEQGFLTAVAEGSRARLVRIPPREGTPVNLAVVGNGDDLVVTAAAESGDATVSSGDGAVIVSRNGARQRPFPAGWRPLCWATTTDGSDEVLAARAGRLAVIGVRAGVAGVPRTVGTLPAGTSAYSASCAGV